MTPPRRHFDSIGSDQDWSLGLASERLDSSYKWKRYSCSVKTPAPQLTPFR